MSRRGTREIVAARASGSWERVPRGRARTRRGLFGLSRAALALAVLAACGSRTGLFVDDTFGPLPPADASADGRADARLDANADAVPPIDATRPEADVFRSDCPDASATLIYVVTADNELFAFDPTALAFRAIGVIACPAAPGSTPFSMAVDRVGVAYVLFNDGELYRVSTATAACVATGFRPRQQGFFTFGMGYATDRLGPTESLYVAGDSTNAGSTGLGRIDTQTFNLSRVGGFVPLIDRAELTGTGDGRLYAFYTKNNQAGSYVGEVDTQTARVIGENRLPTVTQGSAWAFAFWGGDFYLFTAPGAGSRVTRYRPSDNTVADLTNLPTRIVGAGVSTCAPQ
jgi:hypothetical protein